MEEVSVVDQPKIAPGIQAGDDPFKVIPHELLQRIFAQLPASDQYSLSLACQRFLELTGRQGLRFADSFLSNGLFLLDWTLEKKQASLEHYQDCAREIDFVEKVFDAGRHLPCFLVRSRHGGRILGISQYTARISVWNPYSGERTYRPNRKRFLGHTGGQVLLEHAYRLQQDRVVLARLKNTRYSFTERATLGIRICSFSDSSKYKNRGFDWVRTWKATAMGDIDNRLVVAFSRERHYLRLYPEKIEQFDEPNKVKNIPTNQAAVCCMVDFVWRKSARMATGHEDGTISLWKLGGDSLHHQSSWKAHSTLISDVVLVDGCLVSVAKKGMIKVWALASSSAKPMHAGSCDPGSYRVEKLAIFRFARNSYVIGTVLNKQKGTPFFLSWQLPVNGETVDILAKGPPRGRSMAKDANYLIRAGVVTYGRLPMFCLIQTKLESDCHVWSFKPNWTSKPKEARSMLQKAIGWVGVGKT